MLFFEIFNKILFKTDGVSICIENDCEDSIKSFTKFLCLIQTQMGQSAVERYIFFNLPTF